MENKNNKFNKNFNKNNYTKNEPEIIEEAIKETVEETTVEVEPDLVKVVEEPIIVEEKTEGGVISKQDLINLINKKSKYLETKKEDMAPIDYQELSDEIIELKELYEKLYGNKSKSNVIQITNAPLIKNRPKIKNSKFGNNSILL